jgi:hypothetical protein
MRHTRHPFCFYIFICNLILVASCTVLPSQRDIDATGAERMQTPVISTSPQTIADENRGLATDPYGAQLSPTSTIPISSPNAVSERSTKESPITTPVPSPPALSTETSPVSPKITLTPPSVPNIKDVQCEEFAEIFVASQVDMEPIHIIRSDILVDNAIMYMGIKEYIRVFDVSNPATPSLLSVWELPTAAKVSGIEAHDGIGYITSGAALYLVDLSSICQPDLLTIIEMPFEVYWLEKEGDRLYVGGWEYVESESGLTISGRRISIFSIEIPTQPQELKTIELEKPAMWSVKNQKLYFEADSRLFFSNTEEPLPEMQPIEIMLDPQIIAASTPILVGDTLYLHSWSDGVFIIKHLGNTTPVIEHRRYSYPLASFFEVHEDYITLGYSKWCDEPECSSTAYLLSIEDGRELSEISFEPYGEVYRYFQVQKEVIYAFSLDSLFVVDLANLSNPTVIKQMLFLP